MYLLCQNLTKTVHWLPFINFALLFSQTSSLLHKKKLILTQRLNFLLLLTKYNNLHILK